MSDSIDPTLLRGVEVLCLDAGGVVVCLDHQRLAALVRESGLATIDPSALGAAEAEAKRRLEEKKMLTFSWKHEHLPGARAWGEMVSTMLSVVGVPYQMLPQLIDFIWPSHAAFNLWSKVPEGLAAALHRLRATGVRVALVSNSEGMLDGLFRQLGIHACFDFLGDSGVLGVEKPDPRFFELVFKACAGSPEGALHLGDTFATDILGARAASVRTALVDPLGQYVGRHLDVPRVPSARAVAEALTALRTRA